jgi:hypothetical protein
MNLQELLDNLPLELIYKIQSYILKPQPKYLMKDIKHFVISKQIALDLYKVKYDFEEDPNEYKNWLVNDICSYLNEDVAMMYGLVDKFYDICMRYYNINDKQIVINIILNLQQIPVEREVNFLWGIMKPLERETMIKTNNL